MKEKILCESRGMFDRIEEVSLENTNKILRVFRESRVSDAHFRTTSGYAYDDLGRDKLDEVFAEIFGAESALVRTQFASGTHALATVLFGILRPNDELVSITGSPYDTMQTVIKSLEEFSISYRELPMKVVEKNPVFNPKIWKSALEIGGIYVQRGINDFASWTQQMKKSIGNEITPWLNSIWDTITSIPEGNKFDDQQMTLISKMIGNLYARGIRDKSVIKKAFEDQFGEDLAKQLEPMIDASFRGISTFFDEKSEGSQSLRVDFEKIPEVISNRTRMVLIQRSKGYSSRESLSVEEIGEICAEVHRINPDCICFVDNCYGEFVETREPSEVGADIVAGSLIKNPGGGLAPTGGYIVGRKDLVELASYRLTAPGIGREVGASLYDNRILFQGLFLAPHVVSQALKGSIFAAGIFSELGYRVFPEFRDPRFDIIQAIDLETPDKLRAFCRGIQKFSPVDSFATPEAWEMPGYEDRIIMAAGTFVQGASIELSADAPMRAPFRVYLQGGLTFEHAMLGILGAVEEIERID